MQKRLKTALAISDVVSLFVMQSNCSKSGRHNEITFGNLGSNLPVSIYAFIVSVKNCISNVLLPWLILSENVYAFSYEKLCMSCYFDVFIKVMVSYMDCVFWQRLAAC